MKRVVLIKGREEGGLTHGKPLDRKMRKNRDELRQLLAAKSAGTMFRLYSKLVTKIEARVGMVLFVGVKDLLAQELRVSRRRRRAI